MSVAVAILWMLVIVSRYFRIFIPHIHVFQTPQLFALITIFIYVNAVYIQKIRKLNIPYIWHRNEGFIFINLKHWKLGRLISGATICFPPFARIFLSFDTVFIFIISGWFWPYFRKRWKTSVARLNLFTHLASHSRITKWYLFIERYVFSAFHKR